MDDDQFEQEEWGIFDLEEETEEGNTFQILDDRDQFQIFLGKHPREKVLLTPYPEGVRAVLRYTHGILDKAWINGEDRTDIVHVQKSIPNPIRDKHAILEVHGTFHVLDTRLATMNEALIRRKEPVFRTPGDMVKDSLLHVNERTSRRRDIRFHPDGLGEVSHPFPCDTYEDLLTWFSHLGFACPGHKRLGTLKRDMKSREAISRFMLTYDHFYQKAPFRTAGVIATFDKIKGGRIRQSTYTLSGRGSTVTRIWLRVGTEGDLHPYVFIQPIVLDTKKVSRVCISSVPALIEKDIRVGDRVEICKSPKSGTASIRLVDFTKRLKGSVPWLRPRYCECCFTLLDQEKWICPNRTGCRQQIIARLLHIVRKHVLDIPSLTPEVLRVFWSQGWLKEPADIFELLKKPLLDHVSKSCDLQIRWEIADASRKRSFSRILVACRIPKLGYQVARQFLNRLGGWSEIKKRALDPDVEKTAKELDVSKDVLLSIRDVINDTDRLGEIERLIDCFDVRDDFVSDKRSDMSSSSLSTAAGDHF